MSPREMMEKINREIAPSRMSAQDALDWLEELQAEIEGSIDALKGDLN